MDAKAKIAPANSEYSQRLNKIAAALGDNINGQPVNYKVYETKMSTPSPWPTAASAYTAG